MTLTRQSMDKINSSLGLFEAKKLLNQLRHDMLILSKAFEHIAPNRKLMMPDKNLELVSLILKKIAEETPVKNLDQ